MTNALELSPSSVRSSELNIVAEISLPWIPKRKMLELIFIIFPKAAPGRILSFHKYELEQTTFSAELPPQN